MKFYQAEHIVIAIYFITLLVHVIKYVLMNNYYHNVMYPIHWVGIWSNSVIFSKEIDMSKGETQDSIACVKWNDPF